MLEFDDLIDELGMPEQNEAVSRDEAEKFIGLVPNSLIEFWLRYGRGCYQKGRDWICDPTDYEDVIGAVFDGDSEFRPDELAVIHRQSFAELTLWNHRIRGPVLVDFNTGAVRSFGEDTWIDQETGERYSEDFIVSALINRNRYINLMPDPDTREGLFTKALERLGVLTKNELYGFAPALQLGGRIHIDNLRRVKAVPHLLIHSEVVEFKLVKWVFPDPTTAVGHRETIRRIGSPNS